MDRDEAAKVAYEALEAFSEEKRDRLQEALEVLVQQMPGELSPDVIRRMVPEEIGRLTTERTKVAERLDAAMARGALPNAHDYGMYSNQFQLLALWRQVRDGMDLGMTPEQALRKARRAAFNTVIRSNPHIGTPFAQAVAKAAQLAAAMFLDATSLPEGEPDGR